MAHKEEWVLLSELEFGRLIGCTDESIDEFLSAHKNRVTDEEFEKIKELANPSDTQEFPSEEHLQELIQLVRK